MKYLVIPKELLIKYLKDNAVSRNFAHGLLDLGKEITKEKTVKEKRTARDFSFKIDNMKF